MLFWKNFLFYFILFFYQNLVTLSVSQLILLQSKYGQISKISAIPIEMTVFLQSDSKCDLFAATKTTRVGN